MALAWLTSNIGDPVRNFLRNQLATISSKKNRYLISYQIFWFLVMVSWLPLVAGFADITSQLSPWKWADLPQPTGGLASPKWGWFASLTGLLFILGITKSYWNLLCAAPAVIATNVAIVGGAGPTALSPEYLLPLFVISVALSSLVFIARGKIRSPSVAIFLLLAAVESVSSAFSNNPIITYGLMFDSYSLSLIDVIFICSYILLLKFLYLVVSHNIPIIRRIWGWRTVGRSAFALYLWSPMLVIFVVFALIYNWIGSTTSEWTARSLLESIESANASPQLWGESQAELAKVPPSLQKAIDISIRYSAERTAKASIDATTRTNLATKATADGLSTEGRAVIRGSFPGEIMRLSKCGFFDVFCHVMNGIKSVVNSVYRKVRDAILRKVDETIEAIRSDAHLSADQKKAAIDKEMSGLSQEVSSQSKDAIKKVFDTVEDINIIILILSIMTLVKTYLVVFARVVYNDEYKDVDILTVGDWDTPRSVASVRVLGNEFEIRKDDGVSYYGCLMYEPRDCAPRSAWPWPLKSPVGRILSGRYRFGLIDVTKPNFSSATYVVDSPKTLVMWELANREEIYFNFRDVVALSSDIKLSKDISFALPALVFGRSMFTKFVGPGTVIFETKGHAVAGRDGDANDARRASALKAWHVASGFTIQATLGIVDVFLSSYNIRKQKKDDVIYDTSAQNNRFSSLGIITYVRTFMLPF